MPTSPTAIDALPEVPSINDPTNFEAEADAFLGALPNFRTQTNNAATNVYNNAVEAQNSASTATTQSGIATTKAGEAAASATAAATSETNANAAAVAAAASFDNFDDRYLGAKASDPTVDNDGNALITGAMYFKTGTGMRVYNGAAWEAAYLPASGYQETLVSGENIKTINGGSLLGAGDLTLGSSILRSARTANTMLAAADNGKLIDITSGTFTQTFDAAATLGDGWYCWFRNSGTGDVTLDPSGAETIDGLASFVVYPGETRLVQCDGTTLRSIVLNPFYKTFTASGTFTKPPGYSLFEGLLWGAGASGGKHGIQGAGGGGGACHPFRRASSALAASESVTIGSGGTAVSAAGASGNAGGNSTFSVITAYGGGPAGGSGQYGGSGGGALSAGVAGDSAGVTGGGPAGGHGGTGDTGSAFGGGYGGSGAGGASFYGGGGGAYRNGGASVYGGGGGGGTDSTTSYGGGSSTHGGAGGQGNDTAAGGAGAAPGGGGGGTRTGATSGAGARGELRIWGVI